MQLLFLSFTLFARHLGFHLAVTTSTPAAAAADAELLASFTDALQTFIDRGYGYVSAAARTNGTRAQYARDLQKVSRFWTNFDASDYTDEGGTPGRAAGQADHDRAARLASESSTEAQGPEDENMNIAELTTAASSTARLKKQLLGRLRLFTAMGDYTVENLKAELPRVTGDPFRLKKTRISATLGAFHRLCKYFWYDGRPSRSPTRPSDSDIIEPPAVSFSSTRSSGGMLRTTITRPRVPQHDCSGLSAAHDLANARPGSSAGDSALTTTSASTSNPRNEGLASILTPLLVTRLLREQHIRPKVPIDYRKLFERLRKADPDRVMFSSAADRPPPCASLILYVGWRSALQQLNPARRVDVGPAPAHFPAVVGHGMPHSSQDFFYTNGPWLSATSAAARKHTTSNDTGMSSATASDQPARVHEHVSFVEKLMRWTISLAPLLRNDCFWNLLLDRTPFENLLRLANFEHEDRSRSEVAGGAASTSAKPAPSGVTVTGDTSDTTSSLKVYVYSPNSAPQSFDYVGASNRGFWTASVYLARYFATTPSRATKNPEEADFFFIADFLEHYELMREKKILNRVKELQVTEPYAGDLMALLKQLFSEFGVAESDFRSHYGNLYGLTEARKADELGKFTELQTYQAGLDAGYFLSKVLSRVEAVKMQKRITSPENKFWHRNKGRDHIYVFSGSGWEHQITPWESARGGSWWLSNSIILSPEARPIEDTQHRSAAIESLARKLLLVAGDVNVEQLPPPDTTHPHAHTEITLGTFSTHCELQRCYDPWSSRHLAIPSVVDQQKATRLLNFQRLDLNMNHAHHDHGHLMIRSWENRTHLICWYGQRSRFGSFLPGDTTNNAYVAVNETVRLNLVEALRTAHGNGVRVGDVQNPHDYAKIITDCKYCLAPKGLTSYTSRLYESFFGGCIPVILSNDLQAPFDAGAAGWDARGSRGSGAAAAGELGWASSPWSPPNRKRSNVPLIDWHKAALWLEQDTPPKDIVDVIMRHRLASAGRVQDLHLPMLLEVGKKLQSYPTYQEMLVYGARSSCWLDYVGALGVNLKHCSPYAAIDKFLHGIKKQKQQVQEEEQQDDEKYTASCKEKSHKRFTNSSQHSIAMSYYFI